MSAFTQDLARIIKGLASENGVTQMQIAQAVGRSQPYISAKMNGRDTWDTYELQKVAELLGYETAFHLIEVVRVRLGIEL